ncbi:hypothetical protein STRCR_0969 [Streptococcus criceti HS-6]|uniref:Uncharacterized protein n=1 Tax=Streptococcus criceti HS-6 TaxID=873449 RepID=G5JSS1_STRCG|nr:hypothetical protein STRCR_0969 [Streptococcus criceti HS-6]
MQVRQKTILVKWPKAGQKFVQYSCFRISSGWEQDLLA